MTFLRFLTPWTLIFWLPSLAFSQATRDEMDALTPPDRQAAYNYYRSQVRSCTQQTGTDNTCGVISGIGQGDPRFNDPNYRHIPRPTSVRVFTNCDKNAGKFYTTVYYLDSDGQWKNFKSPLSHPSNRTMRDQNGRSVEQWLTSPGIYNYTGGDQSLGRWRTEMPAVTRGEGYITEWHVVSAAKDWEGAQMPWSVWVNGDVAYHASNTVTGYPESHGCVRLQSTNAMALFNLVRHVGTSNMSFHWGGYGETNPRTGQPYCAGPTDAKGALLSDNQRVADREGTPKQIATRSTEARRNWFQRVGDWFRSIGQPKSNTPAAPSAPESSP